MSCGEISVLDGGTIKNSTVLNSQIVNSTIQASQLDSSSITNLASVDDLSAKKIADAIAALPEDQLVPLINALVKKVQIVPAQAPTSSETHALPTTMYGDREAGMGAPDIWAEYGDHHVLPLYEKR